MTRRTALTAALIVAGALFALAGLRSLARARSIQVFGRIVHRVQTQEPRVALSFDDGPAPGVIDSILSVLAQRRVRATFFINGAATAEHPALARRLVSAGHELGNHGWSHERMVLRSQRFYRREVARTDSVIRAAGHQGPIYFRPPYGYKLLGLPWLLQQAGRTTVTWDVEPDSYPDVASSSDAIVRHALERVRPGSIILIHPWYRSRGTSLGAIGPLIDSLQARGYRVGAVRDLVGPQHRLAQPGR